MDGYGAHKRIRGWWMAAGVVQQAFVQILVQSRWTTPYSMSDNFISDLGNSVCGPLWLPPYAYVCSPWWWMMSLSLLLYGLAWIGIGRAFTGAAFGPARRAVTAAGTVALPIAIPENTVTFLHFTGVFAYCGLAVVGAGLAGRTWAAHRAPGWAAWSLVAAALSLVLYVPAGLSGSSGRLVLGLALGTWQRAALLPLALWAGTVAVALAVGRLPAVTGSPASAPERLPHARVAEATGAERQTRS